MDRGGELNGVLVRVAEVTGRAGDLVLMHPGVLHSRPVNASTAPRLMLSQFVSAKSDLPTNRPTHQQPAD
jgi:hypothetical protein